MARESEDIISSDGEVFERNAGRGPAVASDGLDDPRRSIGRAHVMIRLPRTASTTIDEPPNVEQTGAGTIRFHNQGPLGPPLALIGKHLTMRLNDGRTLDFVLCDSGNIVNVRVRN